MDPVAEQPFVMALDQRNFTCIIWKEGSQQSTWNEMTFNSMNEVEYQKYNDDRTYQVLHYFS